MLRLWSRRSALIRVCKKTVGWIIITNQLLNQLAIACMRTLINAWPSSVLSPDQCLLGCPWRCMWQVEQRYRQYHGQMQAVSSSFEAAAGAGSARTYTALALRTISRQFRCLRDAIVAQVRAASRALGEDADAAVAGRFTVRRFIDGLAWLPGTGVTFTADLFKKWRRWPPLQWRPMRPRGLGSFFWEGTRNKDKYTCSIIKLHQLCHVSRWIDCFGGWLGWSVFCNYLYRTVS